VIRVELRTLPQGTGGFEPVAALQVAEDGTWRLDDPDGVFPLDQAVPIVDEAGRLHRVSFREDPARWARNLGNLVTSGHLIPVMIPAA
jgi:hypothetical protein